MGKSRVSTVYSSAWPVVPSSMHCCLGLKPCDGWLMVYAGNSMRVQVRVAVAEAHFARLSQPKCKPRTALSHIRAHSPREIEPMSDVLHCKARLLESAGGAQ